MGVPRVQENGLQLGEGNFFGLQKPNPHKICVMVNNQQTISQAVRRRDVDGTPQVTREMLKRSCRLVRCIAILWGRGDLIQIARVVGEFNYIARHGRHRVGIIRMLCMKALHIQMSHTAMPQGIVTLSN
jgi:hypothetical protein